MTKHTAGPWKAVLIRDGLWHIIGDPYRVPVAVVDHSRDGHPPTRKQAGDDARLIAAAPDLLAALKDCLAQAEGCAANHYPGEPEYCEGAHIQAARAAIAKTEGKP